MVQAIEKTESACCAPTCCQPGASAPAGSKLTEEEVKAAVRDQYSAIARSGGGCCGPGNSEKLGYSAEELAALPEGADMGLGCGNPQAIASLARGETVLDLGAGGGFDCFLAARQVGPTGRVIGVDMTADMVAKARANVKKTSLENVEFRLGEIEHLPVADASVDAILSNCVINLSANKRAVFEEAMRVLRPGGRLAIADVVAVEPLPEALQNDVLALAGCVAGAALVNDVRTLLEEIGFEEVHIDVNAKSAAVISEWMPGTGLERYIASANIQARRGKASP